ARGHRVRRRGRHAARVVLRAGGRQRHGSPLRRDGARVLRGEGAAPRRLRRGVRRRRAGVRGLRQPRLRGVGRRPGQAAPGDRPLGAGALLPARRHLRPGPRGRRRGPDRRLGLQLLGRPRLRRGRHRPAREGRRGAGAAGVGTPGLRVARAHRRVGADLGGVRRRPPRACPRRSAGDDAGGHRGPGGPGRAADPGLLRVVHPHPARPRAVVAQRGDAALGRAPPGLRADAVPVAHLADAGAHAGDAARPAPRRRGRGRGVRAGGAPEEDRDRARRALRRLHRTGLRGQLRRRPRLVRRAPARRQI
ncbi:MAG: peptidase S15, partial [uncultured Actinomycetospora sp.]